MRYDVAIVGAGIVGLAHALAAARRGMRVVVVDRDARAVGASIRNFGFVTVTGQQSGATWARAMRSRDVWDEIAAPAEIPIVHSGLLVVARRPEALGVLEAFRATPMGRDCELSTSHEARRRWPVLSGEVAGVLFSPHERRVESREAIPRLAAWLAARHGVEFRWRTAVHAIEASGLATSTGPIAARYVIVCPGDDLATLYADRLAAHGVRRSKLQMLRLRPKAPFVLPAAVMSDLSLTRYLGYAELPAAAPLRARLAAEQPKHLAAGVHLIVVQSADGSLVVGDTHVYGHTLDPFADERYDALVLEELHAVLPELDYEISERWIGTYASLDDRPVLTDAPAENVRLVVVTSGTGASTAFAIAEETFEGLGATTADGTGVSTCFP
jgi:FAD dependent oxidoreductase TIGR03364